MSETLCVVPDCFVRGRHTTDGCDADCTGCLPGLAADGLRVCRHHHDRARRDLHRLPELDAALTVALTRGRRPSQSGPVGGTHTVDLVLDERVMDHRDFLRERLAAMVAFVAEERGFTGPTRWDVGSVCAWLARSHDWSCASQMAATYVLQLDRLTRRAHALAYPNGTRVYPVGPCTGHTTSTEGERVPCTGTLHAIIRDTESLLPSQLACDAPESHTFAPHEWMGLGRTLHNTRLPVDDAARLTGVAAGTIRRWISEGRITGTSKPHRVLPAEVMAERRAESA